MPSFTFSADLSLIVFFAVVISFVFIVGRQQSVRLIIATYIAVIACEGFGIVSARLLGNPQLALGAIGIPFASSTAALLKIFFVAVTIIIFMVRSGVDVAYTKEVNRYFDLGATVLFGFSTAGLIASTMLLYAAKGGFLTFSLLQSQATLLGLLVLNQPLWFALPAFLIVLIGVVHGE